MFLNVITMNSHYQAMYYLDNYWRLPLGSVSFKPLKRHKSQPNIDYHQLRHPKVGVHLPQGVDLLMTYTVLLCGNDFPVIV